MSSSEKVRASHILIKHQGSRRKSSWKDPDGRVISATTREEAVAQLQALRRDILSGASFKDLASEHSHCSSAKRGGDLGSSPISLICIPKPPRRFRFISTWDFAILLDSFSCLMRKWSCEKIFRGGLSS
ncbi:UNVERIFIED_CONTAM: Peptidyl-prolyl cis-trans isomerase Pin1 [Sesamum latifolium]|uniref:Peptidyl-prolyl cis-trans isomerase n=1 Tax=Sesamum latifolium TaxID=2727402 RepID=A0AAW2X6N5_9LAMI